jgi:chromate transporter
MSQADILLSLYGHFSMLSMLAIGGASTLIPDMHRYLVDTQGWMTSEQFSAMYAISQAAPGPNLLFVSLFGWQIAGLAGAVVSMVGICGPSSVVALGFEALAGRNPQARWPGLIRRGLAALTIGLLLSSGWVLARSVDHSAAAVVLTAATVAYCMFTRLPPLLMIVAGAAVGALGLM